MSSNRKERRAIAKRLRKQAKKNRRRTSNQDKNLAYDGLETRNLLATVWAFNSSTGALTVDLGGANDTASIDVSSGNVTVNGNSDMNTSLAGMQTASIGLLQSIQITGSGDTGQQVTLAGDYSTSNGANLGSVSISGVSGVDVTGNYELSADLTITSNSAETPVNASAGQVNVGGATTIAFDEVVNLSGSNHDFVGNVSITGGDDVSIEDSNGIQLSVVTVGGDFSISTSGNISQAGSSNVVVQGNANINSGSGNVTLDNLTNDFQGTLNVQGNNVTIEDTTDLAFGTASSVNDFSARARGNVTDSLSSSISVGGSSSLESFLGEIVLDDGSHDFGSTLSVTSASGNVSLKDLNDLTLTPGSFPGSLTIVSGGNVSVHGGGIVTVQNSTAINATGNIALANTNNDFVGQVTATGVNISFADLNELPIGSTTASGNLSLAAGTNVFQTSGALNVTGTSTISGTDGIFMDSPSNDFVGDVDLAGGNVLLRDVNDLNLSNVAVTGNLSLTSNGLIAGDEIIVAASTVISARGPVTFTTPTNDFQGHVDILNQNTGGPVSIADANDLTFRQLNINGAFSATAGGSLNQTVFDSLVIDGTANLVANNDITFNNGNNNFLGAVTATAANVNIEDTNALSITSITATGNLTLESGQDVSASGILAIGGQLSVTAGLDGLSAAIDFSNPGNSFGGPISIDNSAGSGNVLLNTGAGAPFAELDISGNFEASTTGVLSQLASSTISITGTSDLSAAGIVLNEAGNDFGGEVTATAQSITLQDTNDIGFNHLTVANDLAITSGGNVTGNSAGQFNVGGDTTINATGNITTSNVNDFVGSVALSGNSITLTDSNSLQQTGITASGDVNLTAIGLSGTGVFTVAGTTSITSDASVTLQNAANDFGILEATITGASSDLLVEDQNGITLGDISVPRDLAINAGGNINQSVGTQVNVGGSSTLASTGDISLGNNSNQFVGPVNSATGQNITLSNSGALTLNSLIATGNFTATASGDVVLNTSPAVISGNTLITSGGDILAAQPNNLFGGMISLDTSSGKGATLASNGDILLDQVTISNDLSVTANNITQTQGGSVQVDGNANFTSTGNVTLEQAANQFNGLVAITGTDLSVNGSNDLNLSTVTATGDLSLQFSGSITGTQPINVSGTTNIQAANSITFNQASSIFVGEIELVASTGSVVLSAGSNLLLDTVEAATQLTITTTEAINQTNDGRVVSGSNSTLTSRLDTVLSNVANDFGAEVTTNSTGGGTPSFSLADANDLTLASSNFAADLTINAGGNVTRSGGAAITVSGNTTITTTGNVTLDNAASDFIGTVSISAANIALADSNDLTLGEATAIGTLSINTGGTLTGTASVSVAGDAALTATNNVNLTNANNDFQSTLNVASGNAVNVVDTNGLQLGNTSAGNTLTLSTTGPISQTNGSSVTASGSSTITAGGSVDLTQSTNDFSAALKVNSPGDVSIRDANNLTLVGNSYNGDLSITTGGTLSQAGALSVLGETTLVTNGVMNFSNTGNNFGGEVNITGNSGLIRLSAGDNVVLGNVDIAQNFTVSVVGSATIISDGSGSIQVDGMTSLFADGGDVTLDNANNDFVGRVDMMMSDLGTLTLRDANDLLLGNDEINNVVLIAGNNISVASSGSIDVHGTTKITAGGNVNLDAANDFMDLVEVTTTSSSSIVQLNDINQLVFSNSNIAGSLVATATGNISQLASSGLVIAGETTIVANSLNFVGTGNDFQGPVNVQTAADASLGDINHIELGNLSVQGPLIVSSQGSIGQVSGAVVDASSHATFISTGDVILDEAGNSFSQTIAVDTDGDVSINDESANLTLVSGQFDGELALSASGDIRILSDGAVTVAGKTTLSTSGGDIVFTNSANDFAGEINATANTVANQEIQLTDANAILLGNVSATGNLTLLANGGTISQTTSGSVVVMGDTSASATSIIALPNSSNDFVGPVSTTTSSDVILGDANDLILGTGNFQGDLTVTAGSNLSRLSGGALTVQGGTTLNVDGDLTLDNFANDFVGPISFTTANASSIVSLIDSNDLQFGSVIAAGDISVSSLGAITQTTNGSLFVQGQANFDAAGDITLDQTSNDFVGPVNASLTGVSQNVSLSDANAIVLGGENYSGDLTIVAGGNISRESGGAISVQGQTRLTTSGDIDFSSATNNLVGNVSVLNSANVNLKNSSDLNFDGLLASGNANLESVAGKITDGTTGNLVIGGATSITASDNVELNNAGNDFGGAVDANLATGTLSLTDANDLTVSNTSALDLGRFEVDNHLTFNAAADLSQSLGGLFVDGMTTINSNSNVAFNTAFNDFSGAVMISASGSSNTVAISDANDISLGQSNLAGNLSVVADNISNKESETLTVGGETTLGSLATINLGNNHDFVGPLTIQALDSATLNDVNTLALAAVDANRLTLSAVSISSDPAESIVVTDQATFSVSTNAILNGNTNEFRGPVSMSSTAAGQLVVTNSLSLELGQIDANDIFQATSLGSITQATGTSFIANGAASFDADGNIILDGPNNDFNLVNAIVTGANDVHITDFDALELGTQAFGGDLAIIAGGDLTRQSGGPLEVLGDFDVQISSGSVSLANSANQFQGNISIDANDISATHQLDANTNLLLDQININGQIQMSTAGSISQVVGGLATIQGEADFASTAGGNIIFNNTSNDFQAGIGVNSSGNAVIRDANNLQLGSSTSGVSVNNLEVTAAGNLTDSTTNILVAGTTQVLVGGDLILDNPNNDFVGTVAVNQSGASGQAVELHDTNQLELSALNLNGSLDIEADSVLVSGNQAITVAGNSSFNVQQDLTLANPGNDFQGSVTVIANNTSNQNVNLSDANDLSITTINTTGDLTIDAGANVSDDNGPISVAGTTTINSGNNVTLNNPSNDFVGSIAVAATGDVHLSDANNILLGGSGTFSGALTIEAPGVISNSNSPITVFGDTEITSDSEVNLGNANNDFVGSVSIDTSGGANANIILRDTNDLQLADVAASGTLNVHSGGELTQATSSQITASGPTSLSAANLIRLDQSGNDFVSAVTISSTPIAHDVVITDSNNLSITGGNFQANLTATAGSDLSLGQVSVVGAAAINAGGTVTATDSGNDFAGPINSTANNLLLTDNNAVSLNNLNIGNQLTINAGGRIAQEASSAIIVSGDTNLTSGVEVFLNGSNNDFIGNLNVLSSSPTHPVFVSDVNDLTLGAASFGTDLGIFAGGDVSTNGAISTNGHLSVFAGGNIDLSNPGNNLAGLVGVAGENVTIVDSTPTQLDQVVADGSLSINSPSISGSQKVTASGITSLLANSGDITLTNSLNRFDSLVNLDATNATISADDIQLNTVNTKGNLSLDSSGTVSQTNASFVVQGTLTVDAEENIQLNDSGTSISGAQSLVGNNIQLANVNPSVFSSIDAGGTLEVSSSGQVSQTGAIEVTGATSVNASGAILLNNSGNDFKDSVSLNNASSTANVDLVDANDIELGLVTTNGQLAINAGGQISQNGLSTVSVQGTTTLAATDGISLENPTNDFVGVVTIVATAPTSEVTLNDQNNLQIANANFGGDLSLEAGGDLTTNQISVGGATTLKAAGKVDATHSANNLIGPISIEADSADINNATHTQLGQVNTVGDLSLSSGGTISQTTSPVLVGGKATLSATDNIVLNTSSNNFSAPVTISSVSAAQAVTIADIDGLTLGSGNFGSDLTINVNGPFSMDGGIALQVAGVTTINAAGNIELSNPANDFTGAINLSGDQAELIDSNDLQLGDIDLSGGLSVVTTGLVSQTTNGKLLVDGVSQFNSTGDLVLANSGNMMTGPIQVASSSATQNVTIVNDTHTELGASNFGANLSVTSLGTITDVVGSPISVAGNTSLIASQAIDLKNANHDFQGPVSANGADVSFTDSNNFQAGIISATGDLGITAAGEVFGGPLQVTGETNIAAGSDITLNHAANSLAGSVSLDTSLGSNIDVTLANSIDTELTDVDISGDLLVTSGAAFTTTGAVKVTGDTTLSSTGDIVLDNPANDFVGPVNLIFNGSAQNVTLADSNDITLGTANYPADLSITADGSLSINNALTVAGDTTIDTGGDALLNQANTDFQGSVDITANDISLRDVNELDIANLDAAGNLTISTGGDINGPSVGPVKVQGTTSITTDGRVILRNENNDFVGPVNIAATTGVNQRLVLVDANDLELGNISTNGKFTVTAAGKLTDSTNANISVATDAEFSGDTVTIGDTATDQFNANRVKITSNGLAEVREDSSSVFTGVDSGSLIFETTGRLLDANTSSIEVAGDAQIIAQLAINIGDRVNDVLNVGRLNIQGTGFVLVKENSSMELFGNTTGGVVFLSADGSITDDDFATINAVARVNFTADSVTIGDTSTDQFNTNSVSFEVTGDASVNEDSLMLLTGVSTIGGDLNLNSSGAILDAFTANFSVGGNADFVANSVWLGDRTTDQFNVGSLSFDTTSTFRFTEDSNTVLTGTSSAAGSNIISSGAISNQADLDLDVTANASFTADSLNIGSISGDRIMIGSTTLDIAGAATLSVDQTLVFAGNNLVDSLNVSSTGNIVDSATASITVSNTAFFDSAFVKIGDSATDRFNAGRLSFQSDGNVVITEDSTTILTGVNESRNLNLTSTGNILDDADAETIIVNTARLTGVDLIIGELADDCFDILNGSGGLITFGSGTVDVQLGC